MKKRLFISIIVLFLFSFTITHTRAQSKRPMKPEDLYKIKKVSDPRVSPDGKWIAYTVSVPDLEKNKYHSDIWLIPITGGEPKRLTADAGNDKSPRWSPDGKQIAFISKRGKDKAKKKTRKPGTEDVNM